MLFAPQVVLLELRIVLHLLQDDVPRNFDELGARRLDLGHVHLLREHDDAGEPEHAAPAKLVHRHVVNAVEQADFDIAKHNDINVLADVAHVENHLVLFEVDVLRLHVYLPHRHVVESLEELNAPLNDFDEVVSLEVVWVLEDEVLELLLRFLVFDDYFVHGLEGYVGHQSVRSADHRVFWLASEQKLRHVESRTRSDFSNQYVGYVPKVPIHMCKPLADDVNFVNVRLINSDDVLLWPVEVDLHVLGDCERRLVVHVEGAFEEFRVLMDDHLFLMLGGAS